MHKIPDSEPIVHGTADNHFNGHDWSETEAIHDDYYHKVYTDGSCFNGPNRALARAGWGVFFGKGHSANASAKLYGPVQTSYRAELRALLHVVSCTTVPTAIHIDCKSVVKVFNEYMNTKCAPSNQLRENDLWETIFKLCEDVPDNWMYAKWMPSHLDEPKNAAKAAKALADIGITSYDIGGNAQADVLAKKGAEQKPMIAHLAAAAKDRRNITVVAQKM